LTYKWPVWLGLDTVLQHIIVPGKVSSTFSSFTGKVTLKAYMALPPARSLLMITHHDIVKDQSLSWLDYREGLELPMELGVGMCKYFVMYSTIL